MSKENTLSKSLWQQLERQNLTQGDYPNTQQNITPWYIRTMQGFAGWLAAVFLLIFIGSVFTWLFSYDNQLILICLGMISCVAAYLLFRANKQNDFISQLALAVSLSGQIMVVIGLLEWFSYQEAWIYFIAGFFQAVLVFLMPNFMHRVLSSWFAMVLLLLGFNCLGIYGLGVAISALLITLILCNEHRWGKSLSLWEPVTYGLALSLVQFNGHVLFRTEIMQLYENELSGWMVQVAPWIASALLGVTFLYLIVKLLHQYQVKAVSKAGILSMAGGVLLILIGLPVVGASSALLILLLGFMSQRRVLMGLGVLSLLCFISWYYYNLNASLLVKSFILMGIGTALLIARIVMQNLLFEKNPTIKRIGNSISMSTPKWTVVAVIVLSLGMVNVTIYQKEQVLNHGQMVLLELAPVDPRSIMQGDFMRLRFSIEQDAFPGRVDEYEHDGFLVVNIDENSVGHFEAFYQGQSLSDNQVKIQYRIRYRNIQFATNAFFFQEGTSGDYTNAKYGEFRVSDSGELLLKSLRDSSFKLLGENKT